MRSKKNLILIIILGFVIRFIFLLSNPSLWGDEAIIYYLSKQSLPNLFFGNYIDFPSHPFLTHIIIKYWSYFSIDERWLRLPSMVASVLSIIGVYLVGFELFKNKKVSLISALLFAYSTYNTRFSNDVKFYSILLFFEIFSLLFFLKIINNLSNKKNQTIIYIFFVLFSFLAFITDYSFFWLFIVYLLYFLVIFLQRIITYEKYISESNISYLFISIVFIPLLFSPWLPKFLLSLDKALLNRYYISIPKINDLFETILAYTTFFIHKNDINVPKSIWWDNIGIFFPLNPLLSKSLYFFLHYSFLFFLLIILIQSITTIKNNYKIFHKILLLLCIIFFPLIISFSISQKYPIFVHYNLMIVQVGIIFLIARYIFYQHKFGIIIILIYLLLNSLSYNLLLRNGTMQEWRDINRLINSMNLSKNDAIILSPGGYAGPFNYYNEKNKFNPLYTIIRINDPKNYIIPQYRKDLKISTYDRICFLQNLNSPNNKSQLTKEILDLLQSNYSSKVQKYVMGVYIECFGKINDQNGKRL